MFPLIYEFTVINFLLLNIHALVLNVDNYSHEIKKLNLEAREIKDDISPSWDGIATGGNWFSDEWYRGSNAAFTPLECLDRVRCESLSIMDILNDDDAWKEAGNKATVDQ